MIRIQIGRRRTRRRNGLRAWRGRIVIAVVLVGWGVYVSPDEAVEFAVDVAWLFGQWGARWSPRATLFMAVIGLYYAALLAEQLTGRAPVTRVATRLARRPMPAAPNEQTFLYRWYGQYDSDPDRLLYVGISNQPLRRTDQHEDHQPWWASVRRSTVVSFPSRPEAVAAEREAIIAERPVFNVQHNGRRRSAWRQRAAA